MHYELTKRCTGQAAAHRWGPQWLQPRCC